ncbi:MAG: hypothetical protein KGH98_02245 [Candidatus Micrarchaeota archaeon]|nr:hypothetical protein [Candidatus Micrarchaeota archaeon]
MMPNIDPRAMKAMMAKMGIKTTEIDASRIVIECPDREIVIESPQVTMIEAQGTVSFQVAGHVTERQKDVSVEITDDDIRLVSEKTGVSDLDRVRKALEESKGDIAQAIVALTEGS